MRALIALATIVCTCAPAVAESPTQQTEPKLVLTNIGFYRSVTEEYFNGNAVITLVDSHNKQTQLNVPFSHVKTIQEAEEQIKPEVERIASEIKKAADDFEHRH